MKVSLRTIKQLVDFELPPVDELVARINQQLGGVEEIIELGERYRGAVVVRVMNVEKHPNADRLNICKVDDGNMVADVERDEDGYVQVVCGAPNVHTDMWAIWLPPRVTVPTSFDDDEPFVLDARKLRGVMSYGMLAAGDELAINSDHDGIIEITEADLPRELEGHELMPGQNFAELFGLDDTIIDIENKMFTHRPDCFGQVGVAREIAGIFGYQFRSPSWYLDTPQFADVSTLELEVFNDTNKAPRVMAVALDNVTVGKSPLWLQTTLLRWGSKSINNVVDATNYIMLLTAQPTHAYDYDKLRGHKLGARMACEGETITLLNGKTYELTSNDIVMADGEGAVGVAGIMGGGDSEVDDATTRVVLEVANFDMYAVRKTSMKHGLFTDALTRFNKGQSPLQNDHVMAALMQNVVEHAGATQASRVFDETHDMTTPQALTVTNDFVNERLGSTLDASAMRQLLTNVEVSVDEQSDKKTLMVTPPFWRTDIEIPEDVVEEIGRLYDFDKLPRELPFRSSAPAARNASRELKQKIRESLSRAGANEVLSYSFVHQQVMTRAEQNTDDAFRLSNALSPELQYFRLSVLPSLLDKVHMNIKAGYDEFTLYEIGKSHNKQHIDEGEHLPAETEMVDAVYARKTPREGASYYHVQRLVKQLAHDLGVVVKFSSVDIDETNAITAPFACDRSACVMSSNGDKLGIVGELKQSVRKQFKLPEYTAAMSLDIASLSQTAAGRQQSYKPLSRFPSMSRDISLRTNIDVSYAQLYEMVCGALDESSQEISAQVTPVSIYQAEDTPDEKTTTFHIVFVDYEKTLTDDIVKPLMDHIASVALRTLDAERI